MASQTFGEDDVPMLLVTHPLTWTLIKNFAMQNFLGASVNGKPPVSKTGTAGSIPAAPAMFADAAEIEGSADIHGWSCERTASSDFSGRRGRLPEARSSEPEEPIPAAPAMFADAAGIEGSADIRRRSRHQSGLRSVWRNGRQTIPRLPRWQPLQEQ